MSETATEPRRAAFTFVFVTVLLDMLALGAIIPVLPKLIANFYGGNTATAAEVYGNFGTIFAAMQFFCAPVLGALSDRVGRRPVILMSNLGLGLDYILMAMAPSISWLFLGRVISGITSASVPTAFAYVADTTPPEKRPAAFGMMGAAFGIGFIVGPALGGVFGQFNPHAPFWVAAGLSLLNAAYGFFVLPESLPKEKRSDFQWKKANPVGSLMFLKARPAVMGLASVTFLANVAHGVLPAVFVLYAGHRYGWEEGKVGVTLAIVGVCSMIVQAVLIRPIIKKLGEARTLLTGLLFGAIGMAIYGLAPTGEIFWLGIPVMALWGLAGPSTMGLMTRRVGPSEQGQLQGANGSLMGVANLISPKVFTLVFATFIAANAPMVLPGAPFLLAAAFLACAAAVAFLVVGAEPSQPSPQTVTEMSGPAH